jgi:glutathione S-transferase
MLRLHHSPLACSLASKLALIESGLPHEISLVRTWKGEQKLPAYLEINPRGKVPALATDAGVLTESVAILPYIASLAPDRQLMPETGFARAQALSWLSFLSSSLHAAFTPALFPPPGADTDAALARLTGVLAQIDQHLAGSDYILNAFSVCDLYLAVFASWRMAPQLAGKLPTCPNIDRLQAAVFSRPGLGAALAEDFALRNAA